MLFMVDSIAQANNKKIIIGECWAHKLTDAEWASNNNLDHWTDTFYQRDDFNYFEPLDTSFTRIMINLSQQAHIDLVDFFSAEYEFGYLTWNSTYASLSAARSNKINDSIDYSNMYNMQLGPLGVFTKNAIEHINCTPSSINSPETGTGMLIYPNPASGQLKVSLDRPIKSIEIYNVLGQIQMGYDENNLASEVLLDLTTLPAGAYLVKALTQKGSEVRMLVKM
jgi:hypothetical protein